MEDDLLKGFMIMKAPHLSKNSIHRCISACFPSLLNCPLVVGEGTCQSRHRSSMAYREGDESFVHSTEENDCS